MQTTLFRIAGHVGPEADWSDYARSHRAVVSTPDTAKSSHYRKRNGPPEVKSTSTHPSHTSTCSPSSFESPPHPEQGTGWFSRKFGYSGTVSFDQDQCRRRLSVCNIDNRCRTAPLAATAWRARPRCYPLEH